MKKAISGQKSFSLLDKDISTLSILDVLWDNGFILGYEIISSSRKGPFFLKLFFKFHGRENVIKDIIVFSATTRPLFLKASDVSKLSLKHNLVLVSTKKGIITAQECLSDGMGGCPVCALA